MFPFFETIRLEKGGFMLLEYHQQRVDETFSSYYPEKRPHRLRDILVPVPKVETRTKCKFLYDESSYQIVYEAYTMRIIERVRLREAKIAYPFKRTDREELVRAAGEMREGEMVVFSCDGYITDSLFSNVIFFDGQKWITPRTYLLNGVKRRFCLDQGLICERDVKTDDLYTFFYIGFINAMIDVGELTLPIEKVEVENGMENF